MAASSKALRRRVDLLNAAVEKATEDYQAKGDDGGDNQYQRGGVYGLMIAQAIMNGETVAVDLVHADGPSDDEIEEMEIEADIERQNEPDAD